MTEPKIAALHLLGRRSEQQDAFMYGPLQSGVVIALADGHGVNGGEAARFAVSQAVEATRANDGHPQSLGEIFLTIHRDITSQIRYGGTTRTLAMLRNGHLLTTVERNLDQLRRKVSENDYWRLKVLIHTHDTFKAEAKPGAPIMAANSHASLARYFLAEFCDDADMLAMVQYHDVPYALWRQFASKGKFNEERLTTLLTSVRDWNLFLAFNTVDGCTAGRKRDPLRWFFQQVAGRVEARFTEADIL